MKQELHVLLVEDNPADVRLVEEMLRETGKLEFEITNAKNLDESLKLLDERKFAVIVVDLGLPDSQGLETFRRIHLHAQGLPIVILTGLDDDNIALQAIQEGAQDYIGKSDMNGHLLLRLLRYAMERKRIEEKLKTNEEFLSAIIDNIPDMIFVKDAKELRFVQFNKAGEDLLGYSRNELIGKNAYDLFPEEDADNLNRIDKDVLGKKTLHDIPLETVQSKNKESRILHTKKIPILDQKGEPEYLLGISEDISERKRLEQQLRQARKMESIGTLAGGIAHDFNNILSAIIGYTELALSDAESGSNLEDYLHEVFAAGKRARDLVKQILTFARQADEEVKPLAVYLVAREVCKFLRASIPTTVEIREVIQSKSLIMADSTQVNQIFMNLCTNASHAMEEKGGILEVGLIDMDVTEELAETAANLKPGAHVKLWVSDTGEGISPDIIGSIFDPYFTTKAPGEGTGMGLAMVHGIVHKHGGEITVESRPGKGTKFTVYLPVVKKRDKKRHHPMETLPTGTERLLFVDDEVPLAKLGCRLLEQLGYQMTMRTSSLEALELFRSKPEDFDLIITDMTMSGMTGDALAAEIMAIRPDIPVILCTGYNKNISGDVARETGIKAFVYKPIVKGELAKTVRDVLDN